MDQVGQRAEESGHERMIMDHGYCKSLYLSDPDGMVVELTVDNPEASSVIADRQKNPNQVLARWLAGDHTPNNSIRSDQAR